MSCQVTASQDRHDEVQALIAVNAQALRDTAAVLESLPDTSYAPTDPKLGCAGVGAHVRHLLDFYGCLLRDVRTGRVDYDARQRDPRLETRRPDALEELHETAASLAELAALPEDLPLRVRIDQAGGPRGWSISSLARELQSLRAHTIHHCASIALLLRTAGTPVPAEFGVAPGTLLYRA